MNKFRLTYLVILTLIGVSSCTQEGDAPDMPDVPTHKVITFRANLPGVDTRAAVIDSKTFSKCCVTCFNPKAKNPAVPYFESMEFSKRGTLFSPTSNDTCTWPNTGGLMDFLAYYPSVDMIKATGAKLCKIENNSKGSKGKLTIDYTIKKFRVAHNISQQIDFIKAYTRDSLSQESENGVLLEFTHQLSRIEISVYRKNDKYDMHVAGVRIGNAAVEGDFRFYPDDAQEPWTISEYGKVEYIYRPGEMVKTISNRSKEDAVSVMGNGGPAMVIPTKNEAWGGKNDPLFEKKGKTMYLSLLVNLTLADPNSNLQDVFPAEGIPEKDQVKTVTFVMNGHSNLIKGRLDEADNKFYGNDGKECIPAPEDEIRKFAWVAIPISVDWKRGKKYAYTLNYSNGIGVRDPENPHPGDPVIGGNVDVSVVYTDWISTDCPLDVIDSTE